MPERAFSPRVWTPPLSIGDPWDVPTTLGASSDVGRVFDDQTELRLSELDLRPEHRYGVCFGHLLAHLHLKGILHGDAHAGNVMLDRPDTGVAPVADPDPTFEVPIQAANMMTDLLTARIGSDPEAMRAVLAGYVKSSRVFIDRVSPGFTDDMLELLGGSVVSIPRLRHPPDAFGFSSDWLSLGVDDRGGLQLRVTNPEASSAHLLEISAGLFVVGADCSALAAPTQRSGDAGLVTQFRAALQPRRHARVSLDDAATRDFIEPLRQTLSSSTPAATRAFVDLLIDVCDECTRYVDNFSDTVPAARSRSIVLAGRSLLLLQISLAEPRHDESRELTVSRRHADLSWFSELFDDGPLSVEVAEYANMRVLVNYSLFQATCDPGDGANSAWSQAWRAFALSRTSLTRLLTHATDDGRVQPAVVKVLVTALGLHAQLIVAFAEATIVSGNPLGATFRGRHWLDDLVQEGVWASELMGLVRDRPASECDADRAALIARGLGLVGAPSRFDFDRLLVHGRA